MNRVQHPSGPLSCLVCPLFAIEHSLPYPSPGRTFPQQTKGARCAPFVKRIQQQLEAEASLKIDNSRSEPARAWPRFDAWMLVEMLSGLMFVMLKTFSKSALISRFALSPRTRMLGKPNLLVMVMSTSL